MRGTGESLLPIVDLNSRLWLNCLDQVTDEMAWQRPNGRTNSIGFIALHLVDARFYLASLIGLEARAPLLDDYASVRQIEDMDGLRIPSIKELTGLWQQVSEILKNNLLSIPEATFERKAPVQLPVQDSTVHGAFLFLLIHESYHIGQMALLRKYFGLSAMRYR